MLVKEEHLSDPFPQKRTTYSTSNLWPDLVSPGINTDNHSETRSQQKQQAQ